MTQEHRSILIDIIYLLKQKGFDNVWIARVMEVTETALREIEKKDDEKK